MGVGVSVVPVPVQVQVLHRVSLALFVVGARRLRGTAALHSAGVAYE